MPELLESYDRHSLATPWWAFQLTDPDQFNRHEQYIPSQRAEHALTPTLQQRLRLGWTRKTNANRDQAITTGAEVTLDWQPNEQWQVTADYTDTDAWSEQDGVRFRTVQIARKTANLGLLHQRARWSAGGSLYDSDPRLRWNSDIQKGGYHRLDRFGRLQLFSQLTLFGRVGNLLDTETEDGKGCQAPGRYWVVGLDWAFGT